MDITPVVGILVVNELQQNHSITTVSLHGNRQFGDKGAAIIAGALQSPQGRETSGNQNNSQLATTNLTSLDLSFTNLTAVGLASLLKGLERTETLTELNVAGNLLTKGANEALVIQLHRVCAERGVRLIVDQEHANKQDDGAVYDAGFFQMECDY
jgi:hypothetical protein